MILLYLTYQNQIRTPIDPYADAPYPRPSLLGHHLAQYDPRYRRQAKAEANDETDHRHPSEGRRVGVEADSEQEGKEGG